MPQIQNVIVFGDSLSDIGTKWVRGMGWVADNLLGAITVNQSGRFSDCRNWTDFMYEEAAGRSLIAGDPKATIALSKVHQKLSIASLVRFAQGERVQLPGGRRGAISQATAPAENFYYANYAEGRATGDTPSNFKGRMGLNTFKDQVKQFRGNWADLASPGPTLFLVWFGANDLYTAECKHTAMAGVARTVADIRRDELEDIVGKGNAHFVFMNMGRPEASPRYQEIEDRASDLYMGKAKLSGKGGALVETFGTDNYKTEKRIAEGMKIEKSLVKLRAGADLYNEKMIKLTAGNGDALVDVATVVNPMTIGTVLQELGLIEGSQPEQAKKDGFFSIGRKKQWVDVKTYDKSGPKHVTCSDKAHPTDRVYQLIWKTIRATLIRKGYKFGLFNK